jgi:hypothetical protein
MNHQTPVADIIDIVRYILQEKKLENILFEHLNVLPGFTSQRPVEQRKYIFFDHAIVSCRPLLHLEKAIASPGKLVEQRIELFSGNVDKKVDHIEAAVCFTSQS